MTKEKLYLVTKSKSWYGNVLAYNKKTSEYIYFHKGSEIWRKKGNEDLFNFCNKQRNSNTYCDYEEYLKFPIYKKYSNDCEKYSY